jgi:signal transduction histidine kinase
LNIGTFVALFLVLGFIFYFARVPLLFLVFPAILMATFRLGFPGGALALAIVAIFSVVATANDSGPFMTIDASFSQRILYVQIFLAILNFTILQTAAALAGKRKAELNLLRMNAQIRRAKEKAETARLAAEEADRGKSAFLASMSHELRTPLNAIIGFSEVMKQERFGPLGGAIYAEYAGDIHESGMHLLSLVNDVLELSRISSGKVELEREVFDLKELLLESSFQCREVYAVRASDTYRLPNGERSHHVCGSGRGYRYRSGGSSKGAIALRSSEWLDRASQPRSWFRTAHRETTCGTARWYLRNLERSASGNDRHRYFA